MLKSNFSSLVGLFVIDVAASGLDINQCEVTEEEAKSGGGIHSFHGTHKCHNTSKVSPALVERTLHIGNSTHHIYYLLSSTRQYWRLAIFISSIFLSVPSSPATAG